jgi:hypothetical protein
MNAWAKIGSRYINLSNVCEVHVRERPRSATLFFIGGGCVDLDEDDTYDIVSVLDPRTIVPQDRHRTVVQFTGSNE